MSLQMDFNPKFSPADWLLVQRKEFYKERNLRWKSTYDKTFYDSERYSGGVDESEVVPQLADFIRLERQGTTNLFADQQREIQRRAESSSEDARIAAFKGQLTLPLETMPRQEATPQGSGSGTALAAGSPNGSRSLLAKEGFETMQTGTNHSPARINRSATRMDPVRTWQGDVEKYPAMKHAESDSVLAKVYTASASMQGRQGEPWRQTMVQTGSGRPRPDDAMFSGCKRTGTFPVGLKAIVQPKIERAAGMRNKQR